jgi:hypothetical protein
MRDSFEVGDWRFLLVPVPRPAMHPQRFDTHRQRVPTARLEAATQHDGRARRKWTVDVEEPGSRST